MTRPIKIDPADGPCPHCEDWKAKKAVAHADGSKSRACDGCGKAIPVYPNMGGAGFESQTVHHYHLGAIESRQCWIGVNRELCRECYLEDFAVKYPGEPLPDVPNVTVPELAPVLVSA